MGKYTDKLNVTAREFDLFCNENDALSDMQEPCTVDGYTYRPAIEWDGPYGKHWVHFDTEEEMYAALDRYDLGIAAWVVDYRSNIQKRIAAEVKAKVAKRKAAKALVNLGGSFPQLAALKSKMEKAK